MGNGDELPDLATEGRTDLMLLACEQNLCLLLFLDFPRSYVPEREKWQLCARDGVLAHATFARA